MSEPVEVNGYGDISANNEASNIFTLFDLNRFHTNLKNM